MHKLIKQRNKQTVIANQSYLRSNFYNTIVFRIQKFLGACFIIIVLSDRTLNPNPN